MQRKSRDEGGHHRVPRELEPTTRATRAELGERTSVRAARPSRHPALPRPPRQGKAQSRTKARRIFPGRFFGGGRWGVGGFGPQTNSFPACPSSASSPSPLSHSAGQSQASNLWRPQLEEGTRERKSKDCGFILTHTSS